jgi:hypothetical protein
VDKRTVADLEAENANLRELIAASKEVADALTISEVQEENDRLRQACRDAVDALKQGRSVRSASCNWCGELWLTPEGATFEEAMAVADKHDRACPQNPLRVENEELRRAIVRLHALKLDIRRQEQEAWAIRQTANDLSAPYSVERVRARLLIQEDADA